MKSSNHSHSSYLMSRLGVAFLTWRRFLQKQVTSHGITLKQQYVLRQLDKTDHLFPSDIASMLFCDRPTATVVIDNMAKQGWITREKDSLNRKFTRISLTPTGRLKLQELTALPPEPFDPLACFSAEETAQLEALLAKLNRHLEQIKEPNQTDED